MLCLFVANSYYALHLLIITCALWLCDNSASDWVPVNWKMIDYRWAEINTTDMVYMYMCCWRKELWRHSVDWAGNLRHQVESPPRLCKGIGIDTESRGLNNNNAKWQTGISAKNLNFMAPRNRFNFARFTFIFFALVLVCHFATDILEVNFFS